MIAYILKIITDIILIGALCIACYIMINSFNGKDKNSKQMQTMIELLKQIAKQTKHNNN